MLFRQLFDCESSTYTYLLASEKTKEALLIDSVITNVQRDVKLINELGLELKYLAETHVHADHITGVSEIKKLVSEAKSIVHKDCGAPCVDIPVIDGDEIIIGEIKIKVIYVPGHTNSCVAYYVQNMVFTGDALLIRGCGRTDFQGGSPETLFISVTEKLFKLPEETLVYPAHDYKGLTSSTIWEEKRFNLRFANKTKEEFINIMNNLNLPFPKMIKESLPANLKCGRKDEVVL
jgi:sulfur dioxygenase